MEGDDKMQKFETLLKLQNFNGSWSMDDQLVKLGNSFGFTSDQSPDSMITLYSQTHLSQLIGTMVGIYILRIHYTHIKEHWLLLERKATEFINENFKHFNIDQCMDNISSLF